MQGLGVSKGVAVGKAFVLEKTVITYKEMSELGAAAEKARLEAAIARFAEETRALIKNIEETAGAAQAEILEGHILMAEDPSIIDEVDNHLSAGKSAEAAVAEAFDFFAMVFESSGDDIMSARGTDMRDIKTRLHEYLTGTERQSLAHLPFDCIIVTHDMTPSDTGQMERAKVLGILTEVGGKTAHTAIIARAMELPAVLGTDNATTLVKTGDMLIIDGETGMVTQNPTDEQIAAAHKKIEKQRAEKALLRAYAGKPTLTADGHKVELFGNMGTLPELDGVLANDAEGIGLFRTEFLFMDRNQAPTEEEQFQIYKKVAEGMGGKEVIIRTLDIGGDKDVLYLNIPKEENPFLGYRAIRMCLERDDIFKPQIRALLRASVYGHIKIMLPMVAEIGEIRRSKSLIHNVMDELRAEGVAFDDKIAIGIMVETPAAAFIADLMATECDFFSIGTNDLTQYTLAVDRGNKQIAHMYSTYNPAVLRAIAATIQCGKRAGIVVGMCGEAAGDPLMVPFLLACGMDEFSMTPSSILKTRELISKLNYAELKERLNEIVMLKTKEEVEEFMKSLLPTE